MIIGMCFLVSMANAQSQKTFVKSFSLQGSHAVVIQLDGEVQIENWSTENVRVQATVEIDVTNDNALKALIAAGRYRVEGAHDGGALTLTSKSREKNVVLRGHELKETLTYKVFVPNNVNVEIENEGVQTKVTLSPQETSVK